VGGGLQVVAVDLTSGRVSTITDRLGTDVLFSLAYNARTEQPMRK
jgi:hypothetical protein